MCIRILSFLFFAFSCISVFSQTQNCTQNINHPGFNSMEQVTGSGTINREYILYVPSSYNPDNPTPLVINYHGFGDCAASYEEAVGGYYGLNNLADQEQFIIAYPQAAYRPAKEDVYWEPGDTGVEDIYENDIYFTEQLILDIANNYNVDQNKVYAVGYSNGGMLSYSVACNRGDLVAAVGVVSGAFIDDDCTSDANIPMIIFHGIADFVLPYNGNQYYSSVSETVEYWLDRNGIPTSSLVSNELKGGDVREDLYTGGNDNTCLSFYTVFEEYDKEGDHVWFSEAINGSTPNEILWNFFSSNCSTVETAELSRGKNITISPNPFFDQIRIQSEHIVGEPYRIFNNLGQLEQSGIVESEEFVIQVEDLPLGMYYFEVAQNTYRIIRIQ